MKYREGKMSQDNKELTYEDIMPGIHWFRTVEIKKTEIGNGRFHREYRGYDTIITPALGEVEVEKWTQIAVEIIKRNGDEDLLNSIIDHVNQLPWLKEKERLAYAAECLLRKSYKAWAERGEFVMPKKYQKKESDNR